MTSRGAGGVPAGGDARTIRPDAWWRRLLPVLALITVASTARGQETIGRPAGPPRVEGEPSLLTASSGTHLWIAAPQPPRRDQPPRWSLLHHTPGMERSIFRVAGDLPGRPDALAAHGNRVWVVFPPEPTPAGRRDVITLRTYRNPAFENYLNDPPTHFDLLPSLSGGAELRGLTGLAGGPAALLAMPHPVDRDRVEAIPPSPLVLLLRGAEWSSDVVPPPGGNARSALLGARNAVDDGLLVITAVEDRPTLLSWTPPGTGDSAAAGEWTRWPLLDEPGWRPVQLLRVGDRPILVSAADELLRLDYLRPRGPLRLAEMPLPDGQWSVVGLDEGPVLLELDNQHVLRMRPIDRTSGELGGWEELDAYRAASERWVHVPVLGMLVVGAVMLVLMFRNEAIAEETLPADGPQPMDLSARVVALLIDYMPGAAAALLITGCPVLDLVILPIWTVPIETAGPPLLALALTGLHVGLSEGLTGRSLGKRLLGGRVVRLDGTAMGLGRGLGRAGLLLLVLAMPIVGIFVFMNVNRRGLPEIATGTVVARSSTSAEAPATPEDDADH